MTTKCIELEFPQLEIRKATIITNNKKLCEHLSMHPNAKLGIVILEEK